MAVNSLLKPVVGAAIALGTAVGCNSSGDNNSAQPTATMQSSSVVPFRVLHDFDAGAMTTMEPKRTLVIADQANYDAEIARYNIPNPQTIDFSTSRVLLVDMGAKPTGGHSLEFIDAFRTSDSVTAQVDFLSPEGGCAVSQSFTQPVIFVEIESIEDIMVSEAMRPAECDG